MDEMDLLEDDNIFTFSVRYDSTDDTKTYDEALCPTIVIDKDKKRIEPFKKLPVVVEDTDVDVGDLIIHNYGNKLPRTPPGTYNTPTFQLDDLKCQANETSDNPRSQEGSHQENETKLDGDLSESKQNVDITCEGMSHKAAVINSNNDPSNNVTNSNTNNSNENRTHKMDELVELDSSYLTTPEDSPNTTQTINPPSGQLLGGNADSLALDLSLTESDCCDLHQASLSSTSLLARHLPAPRFVAHQMALSISPDRYIPKTRPKSNRYSISSSSPSDDGSHLELWGARKKTFGPKRTKTKVCIGFLVAILVIALLCIIIVPVVLVTNGSNNILSQNLGLNLTNDSYATTDVHDFSTSSSEIQARLTQNVPTIAHDVKSVIHDVTTQVALSNNKHGDVTSVFQDVTTNLLLGDFVQDVKDEVTSSSRDIMTVSYDVTSVDHEVTSVDSEASSTVPVSLISHDITSVGHEVTSAKQSATTVNTDVTFSTDNLTTTVP